MDIPSDVLNAEPSLCDKNMIEQYVCSYCFKTFRKKWNLQQHMLIHTGEKPFSCNACDKSFNQKSILTRHKLMHNVAAKHKFFCEDCDKPFTFKWNFQQHKKIHLKPTPEYKCDHCNEVFLSKSNLKQHQKIHFKPTPEYKCDKCQEVFTSKLNLKKHKKSHKIPVKHSCDQCQEVFTSKLNLKQHKKKHLKPAPKHSCDKCSDVFLSKFDLKQHSKNHVKLTPKHSCQQCSKVFRSKRDLFSHVRTEHAFKYKKVLPQDPNHKNTYKCERQNALNVFTISTFQSTEENNQDLIRFLNELKSSLTSELQYHQQLQKGIKWYADVNVRMLRPHKDEDDSEIRPHFRSKTTILLQAHNVEDQIQEAFSKIQTSFEQFTERGSGWVLEKIIRLDLHIAKYVLC